MNVNSDDDAQTRATSSTAIACARIPPPWPPYSSGNARPANPASRHASQLAHGYSSCSSASAAFGRDVLLGQPPHRRAELDVLVGKNERAHAVRPARSPRPESVRSRQLRPPLVDPLEQLGHPQRQQLVGHRVDELAPADVVVRGVVHERGPAARRTRRRRCRRSRAARSRRRCRPSPAPGRTRAARLPAISAITAIASSACSSGDKREPVARPRPRACRRSRRSGPGRPEQRALGGHAAVVAGTIGTPVTRRAAAPDPGGRFCCWRGRSAEIRRHERIGRHRPRS